MDRFQKQLFGALIGLARATDGNEHLITEESTSVILECLAASPSSEEELACLLENIATTKRKMVPDCFLCATPCGRTDAFDLSRIDTEDPEIRNAKYLLLSKLRDFSGKKLQPPEILSLYQGLIAVGLEGLSVQKLTQIL